MKFKSIISTLLLFVVVSVFATNKSSQKVIITGVVENANPKVNYVEIAINRFTYQQTVKRFKIDGEGRFKCSFNLSQSTDLWFSYRTIFLMAVHPGDSIHVIFDGAQKNRPDLLETIKYSGTAAKLNQDIALLQQKYFSSNLYTYGDKEKKRREKDVIKNSTPEQYSEYLFELKDEIYNSFVSGCTPSKEARMWANLDLSSSVLRKISEYPRKHKEYNKLENFNVPIDYYDVFCDVLPLTDSMLICRASISSYTNWYRNYYARIHTDQEYKDTFHRTKTWKKKPTLAQMKIIRDSLKVVSDSIQIYGIIKHTPDTLLCQLVLTEFFLFDLEEGNISTYEKYNDIIHEYIRCPYLLNPLTTNYKKTKNSVDNPIFTSKQILKDTSNSSISELMDSVLRNHRNKVIYIDCWATWCGPCISEIPNSKVLMEQLKNRDVAFVFLCLDSQEKKWKALIDKHQIEGEHHLLSKKQSDDLRKIYEVQGIPHYIIIDKKGTVLSKKYNIRPQLAYGEICKLLKE